jgi:plasmid stability protein
MRRTQIILEEWQYQTLRSRADQQGRSVSDLVREILRNALVPPPQKERRLSAIEGIGQDPSARGREHDRFLYGRKRRD